jgi:hypothetical protein
MLISTRQLRNAHPSALDGPAGRVMEVYFDSRCWRLSYLVVRGGPALARRQVLVHRDQLHAATSGLAIQLTRSQLGEAPHPDEHRPASRRDTATEPWGGMVLCSWSQLDLPLGSSVAPVAPLPLARPHTRLIDETLCSSADLVGLPLRAGDGPAGRLADFLFDTANWQLRFVVATTGPFWQRQRRLLPPPWIGRFDWPTRTVQLAVPASALENCPAYRPMHPPRATLAARAGWA